VEKEEKRGGRHGSRSGDFFRRMETAVVVRNLWTRGYEPYADGDGATRVARAGSVRPDGRTTEQYHYRSSTGIGQPNVTSAVHSQESTCRLVWVRMYSVGLGFGRRAADPSGLRIADTEDSEKIKWQVSTVITITIHTT
jgi:hypothetical protein